MKNIKKIVIFIFLLSVVCALLYFFITPWNNTVETVSFPNKMGFEIISSSAISFSDRLYNSFKVLWIMNLPNYFILMYYFYKVKKY